MPGANRVAINLISICVSTGGRQGREQGHGVSPPPDQRTHTHSADMQGALWVITV